MEEIVNLENANEKFGGKAYGLNRLYDIGIKIPKGFTISNSFINRLLENDEDAKEKLCAFLNTLDQNKKLAIRSSANAEDGNKNSYAGMFETKLNIKNSISDVIIAITEVNSSALSDRVKSYSNNEKQNMNIVIQEMISPILAGVAFTRAIDTNGNDIVLIECVDGLADKLVSGEVIPSTIKVKLEEGIINNKKMDFYGMPMNIKCIQRLLPEIQKIINYFKKPMDIEWCIDEKNIPYIVQARPITKIPLVSKNDVEKGILASHGIAKGFSYVIEEDNDEEKLLNSIKNFPNGGILVAKATETGYLPAMKRAGGIITEEGSALSHAAIVSRELGIPCIAGYPNAKEKFKTGTEIILDASNGRIIANNVKEEINKNASFNFGELYCFDNIIPIEINGVTILLEHTMDGIVVHIPENSETKTNEEIDEFVRKQYKMSPIFLQTPKYLWYFELKRFEKLPMFNETLQYAKKLSKEKNCNKINSFYDVILSRVTTLIEYKNKNKLSLMESTYIEEICMANHFILDAVLPNGFAEMDAYVETLSPLLKIKKNFNDLLNNNIVHMEKNEILQKNFKFLKCISKNRNEICQKFVDVGAMRFDYFDDRENRMAKALNVEESKNIVDDFYDNIDRIKDINIKDILTGKKKNIEKEVEINE